MGIKAWLAAACVVALVAATRAREEERQRVSESVAASSVRDRPPSQHAPLEWMRPAHEVPRWFVSAAGARADNAPGTELAWKTPVSVIVQARAVEDGTVTRYLVRPYDERTAGWVTPEALRLGPLNCKCAAEVSAADLAGDKGNACRACGATRRKGRDILGSLPERVPLFEQ